MSTRLREWADHARLYRNLETDSARYYVYDSAGDIYETIANLLEEALK